MTELMTLIFQGGKMKIREFSPYKYDQPFSLGTPKTLVADTPFNRQILKATGHYYTTKDNGQLEALRLSEAVQAELEAKPEAEAKTQADNPPAKLTLKQVRKLNEYKKFKSKQYRQ